MTRSQKLLPLLFVIIITLTACPSPEHGVSVITIKEGKECISRFQQSGIESFATSYKIDLQAVEAMGGDGISLKIFHAMDENGNGIMILAPASEEGNVIQDGPFMRQNGVCPPMCDVAMESAVSISRDEAIQYIGIYEEATRDDQISAFHITPFVLQQLKDEGASGLKIYHGLDGGDHITGRVLIVMGLRDDRTSPMTNLVYKIDKSRLCPQMCDVIGTTQTR